MKNIPLFKVFMSDNVEKQLIETIKSGWIGEGPRVKDFESALKKYFKFENITTVNAGTHALHLAYHMGLAPHTCRNNNFDLNAEIISSPITCTATNTPILANGAKIVWADVDPLTGNISPESIKSKITDNTKVITMIHWGGNPCLIDEINDIAHAKNIKTVEDGAHSMGQTYKGRIFGVTSDYSIISLQAIKHITAIDGGILFSKDDEDYKRAELLKWFGIDRTIKEGVDLRCEIDVPESGYKFHMNDVNAVVGLENFKHVDEIVGKHQANAKYYNDVFANEKAITVAPENPDGTSAYWLYTIHMENRDELMAKLKEVGIGSSKVHARNDTHTMFKDFVATDLPGAEAFNRTHLCIPVGWWVSKEDREYIAEQVIKFAK